MGYVAKSIGVADVLAGISHDGNKLNPLTAAEMIAGNVGRAVVLKYYSIPMSKVRLTGSGANYPLRSVVIPALTGLTIIEAYAEIRIHTVDEYQSATQTISGGNVQVDNIAAGGLTNAISTPVDCLYMLTDQTAYNVVFKGSIDIAAKVTFDNTIDFQWTGAYAGDGLDCYGITSGIIIHARGG